MAAAALPEPAAGVFVNLEIGYPAAIS